MKNRCRMNIGWIKDKYRTGWILDEWMDERDEIKPAEIYVLEAWGSFNQSKLWFQWLGEGGAMVVQRKWKIYNSKGGSEFLARDTIDGNVEFVHSQYICILSSQVSIQFFLSDKIIKNSDNFRIKCLSYSKIRAILCVIFSVFYTFLFNIGKHVNKYEKISFFLLYWTLET